VSKLINTICSRHDIAEILLKLVIKTKQNYKNDSFIMKASFKMKLNILVYKTRLYVQIEVGASKRSDSQMISICFLLHMKRDRHRRDHMVGFATAYAIYYQ
jgi:hypothetical protein